MATKFYFLSTAGSIASADTDFALSLTPGSGTGNISVTATSASPPVRCTDTSGGTTVSWFTEPLNATGALSAPSMNIWGLESGMNANAAFNWVVAEVTPSNVVVFEFYDTRGLGFSELGTSSALVTHTASSGYAGVTQGNHLRIQMYITNALAVSMNSGFTVTLRGDGASDGADGDSWISFPETITQTGGGGAPAVPRGRNPYRQIAGF